MEAVENALRGRDDLAQGISQRVMPKESIDALDRWRSIRVQSPEAVQRGSQKSRW